MSRPIPVDKTKPGSTQTSASDFTSVVRGSAVLGGFSSQRAGGSKRVLSLSAGIASTTKAAVYANPVVSVAARTFYSVVQAAAAAIKPKTITWSSSLSSISGGNGLMGNTTGTIVYRSLGADGLYVSSNGGSAWTKIVTDITPRNSTKVSCSSDGTKAIIATSSATGSIYTTTNTGGSITTTSAISGVTLGAFGWTNAYVTRDGSLFMVTDGSKFCTSPDGVTWTIKSSAGIFASSLTGAIRASTNGSIIYFYTAGGLRKSTDFGTTWTIISGAPGYAQSIDCSSDGTIVVIGTERLPNFHVSSDSAVSWSSASLLTGEVFSVACSNSGSVFVATLHTRQIFVGIDGGPMTLQTIPGSSIVSTASFATVSGNGSRILANINYVMFAATIE